MLKGGISFWYSATFYLGTIFIQYLFFICDLFSVINNANFANYVDDNTPYVIEDV